MDKLYASPLRVYLLLGALAAAGIYSGLRLPISLFPNSSKPTIGIRIPYGNSTPDEFLNAFGKRLENQLRTIANERAEVDLVRASYGPRAVNYDVEFRWGVRPLTAQQEIQNVINSLSSRLPEESRENLGIWLDNENSGFFAASFFSETRDLNELYDLLEPIFGPKISKVKDAAEAVLWNPSRKEIRVQIIPEAMAALQLLPRDIENALNVMLAGRSGGSLTVGTNQFHIEMPRGVQSAEDVAQITVPTPSGKTVHLVDIAQVELGPKTLDARSFKTSGSPSLILYATPRPGGNVKKMAEDLIGIVEESRPLFPKDVRYRTLVDPSEFIRSAVTNVLQEVAIAAILAVVVLFLFIGSFRNVVAAAIEIPLSMVLAFILMRMTGINLNLISLGGLALSAGMNVDASVVVVENIMRHFESKPGPHDFQSRLRVISQAVREVRFAVIASTVASLVVFVPLTFTSELSYAILGDLALAVVFSHGFSAIVALLLVPTIRLHLIGLAGGGNHQPPLEKFLKLIEGQYAKALNAFMSKPVLKWAAYGLLVISLVSLGFLILPHLPKEVVGIPDTDWMVLNVRTEGNTGLRQMEVQAEEVEKDLLSKFGSHIRYTFNNVRGSNNAAVMARLRDKREMRDLWHEMEKHFVNTPLLRFWVGPWNPSELPIPDPPHLRLSVLGGEIRQRTLVARELFDLLQEKKVFSRTWTEPNVEREQGVFIEPHIEQWEALRREGHRISTGDLADMVRVATTGRQIGFLPGKDRRTEIVLRYPESFVGTLEDISSLPIGIGPKLVPLKALAEVAVKEAPPSIYREDERELFLIEARENRGEENKAKGNLTKARTAVEEWRSNRKEPLEHEGTAPSVVFEDPAKDLTKAIRQLGMAVVLSVVLIFLTLMLQFGSLAEPLLVLVSVPLGFLGVLLSLYIFGSTLSLNSILGVILLNGIAVANSIILVDFIKRLVEKGISPRTAAIEAARKRLRPILITSLTTCLGMLPIALGLGDGGRILQPLGIAVSGGLWVSTLLTLFLVPALQVSYLEWRLSKPLRSTQTLQGEHA